MSTNHLNLFANQYGFSYYKQRIYGVYNEYNVCVRQQKKLTLLYFDTRIEDYDAFCSYMKEKGGEYGIIKFCTTTPILAIVSTSYDIKAILDFVTPLLKLCNATTSEICSFCGERVDNPTYFEIDNVVCVGHSWCCRNFSYFVNYKVVNLKDSQKFPAKAGTLAIFYAFLVTLGITLIYYFTGHKGLFYFGLGSILLGFVTSRGYFRSNGRIGFGGYAIPLLVSMVFIFIMQATTQAVIMANDFGFFKALAVYFTRWEVREAVVERLMPQLVGGTLLALFMIFMTDIRRIRFIRDNSVKITKI